MELNTLLSHDEHLIKLYKIAQDEGQLKKLENDINEVAKTLDKENYKALMKERTFMAYMIGNLINKIRPGTWQLDYKYKPIDLNSKPIVNFLRTENIEIKQMDGLELIKDKLNNENHLFIIDPPYVSACNDFYKSKQTNIYEYFYNNEMRGMKSKIVFILEDNWIIKLLFQNYDHISYGKRYAATKKNTTHLIIKNF